MASWAGKCTIVPEELFNKVLSRDMAETGNCNLGADLGSSTEMCESLQLLFDYERVK